MLVIRNNRNIILPDEMSGLSHLTALDLDGCMLHTLPPVVLKLPNLQYLDLSGNQVSLPDELNGLNNLKVLRLRDCNLDTVPPAVLNLPQLEELDLFGNSGIHLPDGLAGLTNCMRVLKLEGTDMTTVPPVVCKLTQLEWLDLSGNQLQTLPVEIGQLTNVKHLYLSNCKLHTLPPEVWRLTQLEWLDLSGNQLQTLPAEIGQLTNVKHLNLSNCKLHTLPPEVWRLTQLERLDLSGNQLQTLPAEVGRLTQLEWLDLSCNQLQTLPAEIGQLTNVKRLDLFDCQLRTLPPEVGRLTQLERLYLYGNQLTKPPAEVCDQGIAAIRQYFDELERSKEAVSAHLKVVVLGETMAGKTSLVRTLNSGKSTLTEEEDRTHCVEITQLAPDNNITFKVYDFGGNKVYHLTHQFFLTPDAFYLLLVNIGEYTCSEQSYQKHVGFWLDTLNARVPGAVVSIVWSKKDLCRKHQERRDKTTHIQTKISQQKDMWEKQTRKDAGQRDLREKDPSKQTLRIVGDVLELRVSVKPKSRFLVSKSPRSLKKIKRFLREKANDDELFPRLIRTLPRTWVEFEQLIKHQASTETPEQADETGASVETSPPEESQKPKQHWLTMTDCKRIGQLAGLSAESLEPVLSYLQQVGTILRYTDIPELKDLVFHDPPALIELFKDLFHHDTSALFSTPRLSHFTSAQLSTFQSDLCDCGLIQKEVMACLLPPKVNPDIITALMQHFGLCFEVQAKDNTDPSKHTRQYKIPWYLHKQMPEELMSIWPKNVPEEQEQLQLMCNIRGFCPRGLFQRFSVRIHPLVKDRVDWKDGVMAYRQDYPVLVCSKPVADDTYITIATRGKLAQADEMWGVVHPLLEVLVQLLQEWPSVRCSLHVTCAHCIKEGRDRPYQHVLRDRTTEDDRDVRCPGVKKTASTSADLVYRPARLSAVGRGSSLTRRRPSQQEHDCYKMTSDPRGVALIISNTIFLEPENNRQGGEKDLDRLGEICDKLKLHQEIKENLTAQEIEVVTKDVSKRDHSSYDCFVLFLLSHGTETGVLGTDGQHVSVDSIISSFQACKSLVGKPKLFFIQACRGGKPSRTSQTGTEASYGSTEATASQPPPSAAPATPAESPDAGETSPSDSDRLVMYATVHGRVSWRDINTGTWLIQVLADVINEHADTKELHDMLWRVNAGVADLTAQYETQEYKQQPEVTHTLRKRLYFFPQAAVDQNP
ncbi:PREDICTED: malignant fibrous histiocytoma-amplified sequence 1 homolog [Branchiostoma belcheri]|uniref:Malignant fibrous histiocytoma-amplified sequence 1 homolog n=1 Tax=Branchiostoma belcheri TaxID=7741 RepID=A0A6P4Y619_BRABE|nr:PREDICTED: malignant fibrous histiocytoma-amplified sequence 1 homolog [Branchiostoma belcheri]